MLIFISAHFLFDSDQLEISSPETNPGQEAIGPIRTEEESNRLESIELNSYKH